MFGKIATCLIYVWVNNQNVKMLSECNPCTVHFYLCNFRWRPTDNLYHRWFTIYDRLNRSFMRNFLLFVFLFWNQTLVRICSSETASCGVHSDLKLEWTKEASPAQSNVKRPKCDFARLTDCCNKVNNKTCSNWVSGSLWANRPALTFWPWERHVEITRSHNAFGIILTIRPWVSLNQMNIEAYEF